MEYYVGTELYSGDALQHHGILGMKWGVRRTPEQLGHKPTGARHSGKKKTIGEAVRARKRKKQRMAALEKARQAAVDKRTFEQRKKAALEKGSAADILQFQGRLTNKEMQEALTRLDLEQRLSAMSQKNVKSNREKLDSLVKTFGTVGTAITNGSNAYNSMAKVLNSLTDANLPIIGEKKEKGMSSEIKELIRSGDAQKILDNASKLNKDELQEAFKRVSTLDAIKAGIDKKNNSQEDTKASKPASAEELGKTKVSDLPKRNLSQLYNEMTYETGSNTPWKKGPSETTVDPDVMGKTRSVNTNKHEGVQAQKWIVKPKESKESNDSYTPTLTTKPKDVDSSKDYNKDAQASLNALIRAASSGSNTASSAKIEQIKDKNYSSGQDLLNDLYKYLG